MSGSEAPAPPLFFSILQGYQLDISSGCIFLCASGFQKLGVNFVWQFGPTAQLPAALQHLSDGAVEERERRGKEKGEGKGEESKGEKRKGVSALGTRVLHTA